MYSVLCTVCAVWKITTLKRYNLNQPTTIGQSQLAKEPTHHQKHIRFQFHSMDFLVPMLRETPSRILFNISIYISSHSLKPLLRSYNNLDIYNENLLHLVYKLAFLRISLYHEVDQTQVSTNFSAGTKFSTGTNLVLATNF